MDSVTSDFITDIKEEFNKIVGRDPTNEEL
jgi:hypothetical protein